MCVVPGEVRSNPSPKPGLRCLRRNADGHTGSWKAQSATQRGLRTGHRPTRGEEGSGLHGGLRLHLQVPRWRCGSAASKRHSRERSEDGNGGEDGEEGEEWNGRQVGEDDEDWRTGSKERTGRLGVPADDHVPCLLLGRDRMLPFHLGGHLALVHATYPRNLRGRSIDVSMAGWIRDGTDNGRWPNRRRTTPPCRGRMPAVPSCPLPPSGARRPSTYLRQLQLHDLAACAMQRPGAPCLPSSNQPDTSAPAPSANAQLSEPRTGWVALPRGFRRFSKPGDHKNYTADSNPARREDLIDTP